jgi:hypothetical protein
METLGFCIGFGHVFTGFGGSVGLASFAMVDLGFGVDPYFSIATTCGGCGCSSGCLFRYGRCCGFGCRCCYCRSRDRCTGLHGGCCSLGKCAGCTEHTNSNDESTDWRFHGFSFWFAVSFKTLKPCTFNARHPLPFTAACEDWIKMARCPCRYQACTKVVTFRRVRSCKEHSRNWSPSFSRPSMP